MSKKSIDFFGDSMFYDKVIEAFNAMAEGADSPLSLQIAEHEFDITSYRDIEKAVSKFPKVQIITGFDVSLVSELYGQKITVHGGKQTEPHAKAIYGEIFSRDIARSDYSLWLEMGIEEFIRKIKERGIEFRIHTFCDLRTNLHLMTYQPPGQYYPSRVGMIGSGKLARAAANDPQRFWMSAVVDDGKNTALIKEQFERLWKEAIPITPAQIEAYYRGTHMGQNPTLYELYIKVLIDYFDSQICNTDALVFPDRYIKLKYQTDAALQGFDMLRRHNGFFLADVVGLGKTNTAALVTQLFIKANGPQSKALVLYPPNGEFIWKSTFENFGLHPNADFASFEFLESVIEGKGYCDLKDYCLVIIDEAHIARNEKTILYSHLERVCKTPRRNIGGVKGLQKKVILVSATLNNNTPKDIYNPLRLFQNVHSSTIQGVANLHKYFSPKIKEYQRIMRERRTMETSQGHNSIVQRIIKLYEPIRREVLDQITIRRTRNNILNNPVYKADLDKAGISFPFVEPPRNIQYLLDTKCRELFDETVITIIERLHYARYKALDRMTGEYAGRYPKSKKISVALGNLYRNILVKRLESSFTAFRSTLNHLLFNTEVMIQMFEQDKVIIAPELKIKKLVERGWSLEEIIEEGMDRYEAQRDDFVYPASAFDPAFIGELREDAELLGWLTAAWNGIGGDPKFDKFMEWVPMFFHPKDNPTGKLLIFTESAETARYLSGKLKDALERDDILTVCGSDYKRLRLTICENFDANWEEQKDDYNIIVATNCIAETINLHRANVIVNYDTPWNPVILMQRIGRLNRIGSVAERIINYLFYPSAQGDASINLYKNAVIKLQGFHAAFGEDSQIFSNEEIVQQFELFNPSIGSDEDRRGALLNELRDFHSQNPAEYERIKALPPKSRAFRDAAIVADKGFEAGISLLYIDSAYKSGYYCADKDGARELTFLEAAELFRAGPDEKRLDVNFIGHDYKNSRSHDHYRGVGTAFKQYRSQVSQFMNNTIAGYKEMDERSAQANKFLRLLARTFESDETKRQIAALSDYLRDGVYAQLPLEVNRLKRKYDTVGDMTALGAEIEKLYEKYYAEPAENEEFEECEAYGIPRIMVSETFI